MENIVIALKKPYTVTVGSDLLKDCGAIISKLKKACKVMVISDSNVFPLYGNKVIASLESAGFTTGHYVFEAGEQSKTLAVVGDMVENMARCGISRTDIVVALGGGVTGDMAGFASAIYQRGIPFVQIPTTLLAAVDSSVGGKTGADLLAGKNLVGAFHQPLAVICDTDTFDTLPKAVLNDGLCEVIKYGCILDKELFDMLGEQKFEQNIVEIVSRCVKLKGDIVVEDEFDTGRRQILNFGHTMGHAIEALSDFQITHGRAVAMGMYYIEKADNSTTATEIKDVLDKYDIDISCDFTGEMIAQKAGNDKKIRDGKLNLILLNEIGDCRIEPTEISTLESFFEGGLSQ